MVLTGSLPFKDDGEVTQGHTGTVAVPSGQVTSDMVD